MKRALSFLTVLGRAERPDERTLSWFPIVGLLVGALVGYGWWAAGRVWPAAVAAVIAVGVDAAVTGCLHLDGLADAADGLMVAVERPRRLEIMADPRVGVFGAVALVVVLALRVAAFGVMTPHPVFVMGIWCGSRTIMAIVARSVPYAHEGDGTASAFLSGSRPGQRFVVAVYGMGMAGALAAAGAGWRGLAALAAEVVLALSVVWLGVRRLGGFTGDVLGAAGVVGETAGLLALAVR